MRVKDAEVIDTASGKIKVSPFTFLSINLRENMLKYKKSGLHRLSVMLVFFIGTFALIQSFTFKSMASKNPSFDDPSTRMHRKHAILKRGCSMVKSLFDMSKNGTSFDVLLEWHQRIENISHPLPVNNENECYPPLNEVVIGVHQIHTENSR